MEPSHTATPTVQLVLISAALWLAIALLAILNGIIREKLLMPNFGAQLALPLSALSLSLLVLAATYLAFPLFGHQTSSIYLAIGLQWVLMTLAFELLFGHYVIGKSWTEILRVFNPLTGDLFLLVLAVTFFAPYLVARIKGIL